MPLLVKVRSFVENLLFAHRADTDLDHEVHAHCEMLTAEKIRAGMEPDQAQRAARIELGGLEQVKEQVREARLGRWLHSLLADCRFALRQLRKSPSFTLVSLITLTVGIGANTAIFSFADLLLHHPVSLPHFDRLVSVDQVRADGEDTPLSAANFRDLRAETTSLKSFAAYQDWTANLVGSSGAEEYRGIRAGEDFFDTLEAPPLFGRTFFPEEHAPGKNHVVVLSYAFWQREFAGNPGVLDRTLRLDGQNYTIIGVMPQTFQFPPGGSQFWAPLALDDLSASDRVHGTLSTVGRRNARVTFGQSRSELDTLWRKLVQHYPDANRRWKLRVQSLGDGLVDEHSRQFAALFLCVAGFVLLIACVNLANLQLARAASRGRELTIRAALGAEPKRIIRQLLTESLLLAGVGSVGGAFLAFWGVSLMRAKMPAQVRQICDVAGMQVDLRALLFTFCAATASGLLSGMLPALRGSNVSLRDSLETGGARVSGGGQRLRRVFVFSEVVLSVILLVGAGLMVKGFYLLANRETTMHPETLLTFHVNLSSVRYPTPQQQKAFYTLALDRLRGVPRVEAASAVSGLPFSFYENEQKASTEETSGSSDADLPSVMEESVTDDYFRVLRLALLEGRYFEQRDGPGAPAVAIVSASLAQRWWPGTQQIVGRRLKVPGAHPSEEWITVVGVVGDTRHEVYDRAFRSVLYRPLAQASDASLDFALRTSGDPHPLISAVRSVLGELDPTQPVMSFETMTERIEEQASALEFVAVLMGFFGLLAVLLSAAGIYGLISYSVAERQREIGIRIALGARTGQVLAMVVKSGLWLVAVGGAIGLLVGFLLALVLSSLLYGVAAWDFTIYALVPLLLLFVALAATSFPAWQATRVDPMVALRYQ